MFRKKDTGVSRKLLEGIDLTTLVHGDKTLMGQFKLAKGSIIPTHSHPHEQTGIMISGKLRFVVEGETMDVESGDSWCLWWSRAFGRGSGGFGCYRGLLAGSRRLPAMKKPDSKRCPEHFTQY